MQIDQLDTHFKIENRIKSKGSNMLVMNHNKSNLKAYLKSYTLLITYDLEIVTTQTKHFKKHNLRFNRNFNSV